MSTESDGKGVQKAVPVRIVSEDCATFPDRPMTIAQRRGLARKITAYLKRAGLDCELLGDARKSPRMLN